jgi:hypothetical protein
MSGSVGMDRELNRDENMVLTCTRPFTDSSPALPFVTGIVDDFGDTVIS